MHKRLLCLTISTFAFACDSRENADPRQEVLDTEQAFADTMAARDFDRFKSFVADDAVFFAGDQPLRGKPEVVAHWARYFESTGAPFSWQPAQVEVLASGSLALSTGPVHDSDGKSIATFTSIWRREASGAWRIIFDKGEAACDCAEPTVDARASDDP
jgi:ketosteroid isomerase-like protein